MATNKQEYEKIYFFLVISSYVILTINLFYYAQPVFSASGLTHPALLKIMLGLREGGIFRTPLRTKAWAFLLMVISHVVRSGKGKQVNWWLVGAFFVAGLVLYAVRPRTAATYMVTTVTGFVMCAWAVAMVSRNLHSFRRADNDVNETFEQCDELISTPDSINIPTKYQYKKKIHNGWINVVNPFRATMVLGVPGSGKSYSVYNPFIEQMVEKGYSMFVYDYKFPDLTEVVYNETLRKYHMRKNPEYGKVVGAPEYVPDPSAPKFYVINFKDPRYSNRCNPIHPSYILDPADSAEIADIVMKNVAPGTVEKEDFFAMSAKVYLDAIIYFLSIYEDGRYCTFPHVIELMSIDYKKIFSILSQYPQLETKIKPFASALEAGAQDQLQGQIASATIPLNKMASPALYWVLSGDDFRLDLNDPDDPKTICIGNDPDRQQIYGTTLSLFTSRMFKLINHKGKRKCGVLLDELPTIFIKGLDNLIATARSNKVAIVIGAQDKSQLIRDYSQKEADVIFNTVGNIFSGQVNGKTAEDLNKSFGREFREQQSQTQNIDSESISISFHQEELMPISKIETLTQGYFFGKVADNNDTPIEKKFFCGEIQIDNERQKELRKTNKKLPRMTDFGEGDVYASVHEPKLRNGILRSWAVSEIIKEGIIEDGDSMERRVEAMIGSLTEKEIENILSAEAERQIADLIQETIENNFTQIRQDVQDIVDRLLPDGGDPLAELD
jgi:hypothetical protein